MSVSLMGPQKDTLLQVQTHSSRHGGSKVEPSIDEPIIFGAALTLIGQQKCESKVKNMNTGGSQATKSLPVDEQNTG